MLDGGRDRKGHGRLDAEGDADKEEDWGSHRNNERKESLGRKELGSVRGKSSLTQGARLQIVSILVMGVLEFG